MIGALAGPILGILDKVLPDRDAKDRAAAELMKMEASGDLAISLAQAKVNEVSAAHQSLFVAGARPAALWLCVVVLAYHFLLADWAVLLWPGYTPASVESVETIMLGLLGLTAARSAEKWRGVARER